MGVRSADTNSWKIRSHWERFWINWQLIEWYVGKKGWCGVRNLIPILLKIKYYLLALGCCFKYYYWTHVVIFWYSFVINSLEILSITHISCILLLTMKLHKRQSLYMYSFVINRCFQCFKCLNMLQKVQLPGIYKDNRYIIMYFIYIYMCVYTHIHTYTHIHRNK